MEKNLKEILGLRLREYAITLKHIQAALDRVEKYDDDDYSPSRYTPSRNESRKKLDEFLPTVTGYCLACDDVFDREYGTTESFWYEATKRKILYPELYPELYPGLVNAIEVSEGNNSSIEIEARIEAEKKYIERIFRNIK